MSLRLQNSLLTACLFLLASGLFAQHTDKRMEAALRKVGDRLLLQMGDSTSRVMPLQKEEEHYVISFQDSLTIEPGILVSEVEEAFNDGSLTSYYLVEIRSCQFGEVVYSYEMNRLEQTDIVPCQSRSLPEDCYQVVFTVLDEVVPVEPTEEEETPWFWYLLAGLLIAIIAYLVLQNKKKPKKEDPNLIRLGRFAFDTRNSELVLEDYRIELSAKEADLLMLLHGQANTQVEREVILNKVWGDEGDYVGRTLDVFISKLRKKLQPDPGLKIVNIRGVGYKLVLNED